MRYGLESASNERLRLRPKLRLRL